SEFLEDIAQFFILFQSVQKGFSERAAAVQRLLADRRTTFMVVSTLEGVPLREAEFFAEQLSARKLHLGAIVLNKVLPDYLLDPGAGTLAEAMRERARGLGATLAPDLAAEADELGDVDQVSRVLEEVAQSFLNFQVVARREMEERQSLAVIPEVLATVPFFDTDIYDLGGLVRLGDQIWD
ncbi:MAG: hypothetical protein JO368_01325, partial [Acidimicrobiales bacterium]|nr:hypothetical protein [Acidimicrobiales bacterium]